ncbi:hypothetical protein pb186bvf_009336 [Paramecium bursaria]
MQQSQEEEESQQIIEDYNKVVVIDNPRETVTMKKIRELLAQDEPDWDRIKDDQNHFLFMLGLQNLFQLWLLLLLYYLNIGTQIAEFMVFPIDFCLMSMYIMTLVIIQFKEHDWILPPFNFLLCVQNKLNDLVQSFFYQNSFSNTCYIQIQVAPFRNNYNNVIL